MGFPYSLDSVTGEPTLVFMHVTATTIHMNLSLSAWDIFSATDVCNNYVYNIYNDRPLVL